MNKLKWLYNAFLDKAAYKRIILDNAHISLLSRRESIVIKGFLMILIVLSHNKYIMSGNLGLIYLYSFHIYSFYFLPFLYDIKQESFFCFFKKKIRQYFLPYSIIFVILIILNWKNCLNSDLKDFVIAYITGSQITLRETLHSGGFLWFIPTMFSLLCIRKLYYNQQIVGRSILLIISLILLICYIFKWIIPVFIYTPFSITIATAMLLPSVIARYLITYYNKSYLNIIFFTLIIVDFIILPLKNIYTNTYNFLTFGLSPILIFTFIISMRYSLIKNHIFNLIGIKSYPIYIIHIFVYTFFYLILDNRIEMNLFYGIILMFIVLLLSYIISKVKIITKIFS